MSLEALQLSDNIVGYDRQRHELGVGVYETGSSFLAVVFKQDDCFKPPIREVEPYTLHDLRRTFASTMALLGVPIHVTEKLLNHVSGSHGGIVGVYQRYSYMDEMKEAVGVFEAWLRA